MLNSQSAEEHLRIIRSLMEKATVYRAISAHAALMAGGIALATAIFLPDVRADGFGGPWAFHVKWLVVLVLSALANFYFLHRDAERRGEAFISPGMKMALRAMLPPLLVGGVFTILMPQEEVVPFWQIAYGLALLSTVHFAPKSLERLGWAFLLLGLGTAVAIVFGTGDLGLLPGFHGPDVAMGLSFGLLHLLYAVLAWPRTEQQLATAN